MTKKKQQKKPDFAMTYFSYKFWFARSLAIRQLFAYFYKLNFKLVGIRQISFFSGESLIWRTACQFFKPIKSKH